MIFDKVSDVVTDDIFLRLPGLVPGVQVFLKLEGLNPAGSIKLKTATALIRSMEEARVLRPGSAVIESSSGNLGIALAMACMVNGYPVTVVTDPNASRHSIRVMRSLGAEVVEVSEPDEHGGYLHTRIDYIHRRLAERPGLIWLNQYANTANIRVHRDLTARSIHKALGRVDALFVGAGTTGTLMGCLEYFARHSPETRVVAVDSVGSITFGNAPGPRFIPGLGSSRKPEIYTGHGDFEKVLIPEQETVATCRAVAARYGLLAGGSTGTVVAAVRRLAPTLAPRSTVVAISPDLGDKYIDTIYSDSWVAQHFQDYAVTSGAEFADNGKGTDNAELHGRARGIGDPDIERLTQERATHRGGRLPRP